MYKLLGSLSEIWWALNDETWKSYSTEKRDKKTTFVTMAVDVVYRAKNDVVAARRTRCARFVTDRYNLVRRGSRDAPGCTRGTIVSQVTVSSFMHGRNHYPRLCIRVNGNTCFRSLLPHCSSPSLFLLLPRYRMLPPQQKFQFQFPNPSCYQTSCKYAASVHYCKQK